MHTPRVACVLLLIALLSNELLGQGTIPLGSWRMHVSYNDIRSVAIGEGEIYATAPGGVLKYDKASGEVTTYNKLSGLSFSGITHVAYDITSRKLLIGYDNGTFDVVDVNNNVKNLDPARNTVLTGPRTINAITVKGNFAYLATDYGVLVFDLAKNEIKETWRDLGVNGGTLKIFDVAFLSERVYLSTENGILTGDLQLNLLDFNQWTRYNQGDLNSTVHFIEAFNNSVFAIIDELGVYKLVDNDWSKQGYLDGITASGMNSSNGHLLISETNKIWVLDSSEELTQESTDIQGVVRDVQEDATGKRWVGSSTQGLITNVNGPYVSIIPNGPSVNEVVELYHFGNKIYFLPGGYSLSHQPLGRVGRLNIFDNGSWSEELRPMEDLTSIAFDTEGTRYISSFGYGVERTVAGTETLFDESNSTLVNISSPQRYVTITDIEVTPQGLWASNYDAMPSLHFLTNNGNWESYNLPIGVARYPVKLKQDFWGNLWVVPDPELSGGLIVFNKDENKVVELNNLDNKGELPSNKVYAIETDRDGYVWVGTDAGIAYFFDKESDAIKPIFENRFLLRDDKVKTIAVDGGNRKWIGTERGVWLFNPTGETSIANFTAANSPLPSDLILDIEINPVSGEVFIATDKGIVSFRSDATESTSEFADVKIFPNPVANNFNGLVGISGVATDAIVKITDVSGKLIFQTQANGGSASWNVHDHQGRRVNTGIFLVYAVTRDGRESVVGKIAVIN